MTATQAIRFLEVAREHGFEAQPYESYSGRGMFGRTTEAVVVESRKAAADVARLLRSAGTAVEIRTDSLGRDCIAY